MNTVENLRVGGVNVDKSFVSSDFELLSAVLILVRRTKNGYDLFLCGKGDRTAYLRACFFMVSTIFSVA